MLESIVMLSKGCLLLNRNDIFNNFPKTVFQTLKNIDEQSTDTDCR